MNSSLSSSNAWSFYHHNFAAESTDGLPLGNGDLGALVIATQGRQSYAIAKSNVWDERCDDGSGQRRSFRAFENFEQLRNLLKTQQWDEIERVSEERRRHWRGKFMLLPAATLHIETGRFEKEIEMLEFHRHLDMRQATAVTRYRTRVRQSHTEAFVSSEHEVLVIRQHAGLDATHGSPPRELHLGADISLEVQLVDEMATVERGHQDGLLWLRVRGYHELEYVVAIVIVPNETTEIVTSPTRLTVRPKHQGQEEQLGYTLLLAVVSNKESGDCLTEAIRRVNAAAKTEYTLLKNQHREAWQNFWDASRVDIPDEALLRQYYLGLYLLNSSSRRGYQMPGLQGLWASNKNGSGWNDYTNDLNIQMCYWPIYTANHLELGWPYYETVSAWLPQAKADTCDYYSARGAQFGCCSSPTGISADGYVTTLHWAGHAAFVAQNFWTHYQYSRDSDYLRTVAYPLLKECAIFYLDFLQKDERGVYAIWPSNTPEAGEGCYEAWGKNPVMDIALISLLFQAVIESANVLDCDEELTVACAERLERWPAYPMRDGRLMDMEDKDFLYSHRHPGMLTPAYPCSDVDHQTASRTLDAFVERGQWLWCGFSHCWVAATAARVGRGALARDFLAEFVEVFTLPQNGLHLNFDFKGTGRAHAGPKCFTNEANSGFSAALLEMLLQSHGGVLRVFPAIPEDWREVSFENLRAQSALVVSASRREGETREITIKCEHNGKICLQNPASHEPEVFAGDTAMDITESDGTVSWQGEAGNVYRVRFHQASSPQS